MSSYSSSTVSVDDPELPSGSTQNWPVATITDPQRSGDGCENERNELMNGIDELMNGRGVIASHGLSVGWIGFHK
jgi:hypothetical protein